MTAQPHSNSGAPADSSTAAVSTTVTDLVRADIDAAVADGCRWDSPYFAHGRAQRVVEDTLLPRMDQLLPVHAKRLAADLRAASARPEDLKHAIRGATAAAVDAFLNQRTASRRGWRPSHPGAPA